MSRYKRLVLTFDAFGTLFTPREPIGQQYVCTFPIGFRHSSNPDYTIHLGAIWGHGRGFLSLPLCFLELHTA